MSVVSNLRPQGQNLTRKENFCGPPIQYNIIIACLHVQLSGSRKCLMKQRHVNTGGFRDVIPPNLYSRKLEPLREKQCQT